MNLAENVDEFHIVLSNNSSISVSIGENPKFKNVKLYLDGQYVLSKTLWFILLFNYKYLHFDWKIIKTLEKF